MKNNKIRLTIVANKAFIHEDRIRYWNKINELLFKEKILNFTYTYGWYKCNSSSIKTLFPNITNLQTRLVLSEPTTFSFNYWFNKKYIIDKKSSMKQLVHSNYFTYDEIMNIYIQIIVILNQMIKYKLSIADLSIDDFAIIDTTNKLKRLNKTGLPVYICNDYWVYSFQNKTYYVPNLGFMVVLHDRFNQEENSNFKGRVIDEKNRYNRSNFEEWQKDENQIRILQKIYSSIREIDQEFRYNIEFNKFIEDINNKILKDYDLDKKQIGGKTKFRKSNIPYEMFYNNEIDEKFKKDNKIKTCPYWEGAVKLDNDKKGNNLYKLKIPLEYSNEGVEGIDYIKIKKLETFCPHVSKYEINEINELINMIYYKSNELNDKENNLNINADDEEHFSIYDHSYSKSMKFELKNNKEEIDFEWYYLNNKLNKYEYIVQNIKIPKYIEYVNEDIEDKEIKKRKIDTIKEKSIIDNIKKKIIIIINQLKNI